MDMQRVRKRVAAILFCVAGLAAAQDFPTRPIKWIVPFLPGTSPDQTARITAEAMADILRQPVVVENRPGAAGSVGAQVAAKAPADGHTWVYTGGAMASSMRMQRQPGYDVLADFTHVGRIGTIDLLLVAAHAPSRTTLGDLLQRAREQPGRYSYGSGGIGSPAHLGTELLLHAAGARALHVPYKGPTESTQAVASGQVDFALATLAAALPLVEAKRLVPLAVTGARRHPLLPEVPTLAEEGFGDITLTAFGGLSVPVGTAPGVVRRINDALRAALSRPDVRSKLEVGGGVVWPSSPEEYADMLRSEIRLTERMMKAAGLEAQ